jgi:prevent-host-death family protein
MRTASVAKVKARFSAYLRASEKGPVVVTRNGRPAAVLLPAGDKEELQRLLLAYSPRFRGILDAARERIQKGIGIRHEDFWREMEAHGRHSKTGRARARPHRRRRSKPLVTSRRATEVGDRARAVHD